jgi:hypothetical protein
MRECSAVIDPTNDPTAPMIDPISTADGHGRHRPRLSPDPNGRSMLRPWSRWRSAGELSLGTSVAEREPGERNSRRTQVPRGSGCRCSPGRPGCRSGWKRFVAQGSWPCLGYRCGAEAGHPPKARDHLLDCNDEHEPAVSSKLMSLLSRPFELSDQAAHARVTIIVLQSFTWRKRRQTRDGLHS